MSFVQVEDENLYWAHHHLVPGTEKRGVGEDGWVMRPG